MEAEVSLRKQLDELPESSRYNSAEFWAPPIAPVETPTPASIKVSVRVPDLYQDENDPPQLSQHTDADEDDSPQLCQRTDADEDGPPELSQHSRRSFGSGRKLIRGIQTSFGWTRKLISGIQTSFGLRRKLIRGIQASFGQSRKLITGIAVVLALGLSALAYFFLAPSGKTITQTAEHAPGAPHTAATPAAPALTAAAAVGTPTAAPGAATPSATPAAAAWPHSPRLMNPERPPESVQASPKVAQNRDVLYLQRPGVNIRSTPSPTGSAVGTAPKGTRFKVTNRQGDWIQVESGRLKGWINAAFLAPSEPR